MAITFLLITMSYSSLGMLLRLWPRISGAFMAAQMEKWLLDSSTVSLPFPIYGIALVLSGSPLFFWRKVLPLAYLWSSQPASQWIQQNREFMLTTRPFPMQAYVTWISPSSRSTVGHHSSMDIENLHHGFPVVVDIVMCSEAVTILTSPFPSVFYALKAVILFNWSLHLSYLFPNYTRIKRCVDQWHW
jgi:hypothetical protein